MTTGTRKQGRAGEKSPHAAAWLAWSLCALALALTALSLLPLALAYSHPDTHIYAPWLDNTLTAISFAPVGALIASRHPANPVGWLLCLYGVVISVSHFSAQYAIYALLAQPGSLPAGEALAWVASWLLPVIIGLQVSPVLLFPTGRLPSRRWRWLVWLTVAFVLSGVAFGAISPGSLMGVLGPIRNPFGIEGLSNVYYEANLYAMSTVLLVAAALSVFVRLLRAVGVERQQLKWFAYAAAATAGGTILAYLVPGVIETPLWFERIGFALNIAFIPAIPVAIGMAILRYRLYDIDLLINRTLVYGSLTALLTLVYLGGVTATQTVLQALTGQAKLPQASIVASTLVIAALFNPLRRRVQAFVDRRFYRRRYDAVKTLEAFNARLREETDLISLSDDLVGVARGTVQPVHASLWLRPEPAPKADRAG
ncbi:MAG TPA: hypothetical protein VKA73_03285 [Rubrobacter sp.]|nr:hypothetical protein [Rubrobacter sp.]